MPTIEERIEIAERLRNIDRYLWYDAMDEVISLETAIGCSIGQDMQDQDWCNRLADLIEPEPERTCHMTLLRRGTTYDVFYFDCCGKVFSENRNDKNASSLSGDV